MSDILNVFNLGGGVVYSDGYDIMMNFFISRRHYFKMAPAEMLHNFEPSVKTGKFYWR